MKMLLFGLLLFVIVYFLMGTIQSELWILFAFLLYGIYASATEGISKAWISNVVPSNEVGTAIGMFTGLQSIATFFASSIAGWIWYTFGAPITFFVTGVFGVLVWIYLLIAKIDEGSLET